MMSERNFWLSADPVTDITKMLSDYDVNDHGLGPEEFDGFDHWNITLTSSEKPEIGLTERGEHTYATQAEALKVALDSFQHIITTSHGDSSTYWTESVMNCGKVDLLFDYSKLISDITAIPGMIPDGGNLTRETIMAFSLLGLVDTAVASLSDRPTHALTFHSDYLRVRGTFDRYLSESEIASLNDLGQKVEDIYCMSFEK